MRNSATAILAMGSTLAACAPHIAGSERPPADIASSNVYYDTQTIVGPCATDAEALPLVAAVASAIIAQGVNRIGTAIKSAAETETKIVTARRNVELRRGKGLGPCVTVVRGWFYRTTPTYPGATDPSPFHNDTRSSWTERDNPSRFWRWGLFMASTPDFYFQGRIVASTDGAAYTVLPVTAFLDRPISNTPLRPSGTRSVLVSFAFSEVGKSVDLQKGGGTTMVLGRMQPGKPLRFEDVSCYSSGSGGTLARSTTACPAAGSFDTLVRSPFESDWFSVALDDKRSRPMTVQALVSETRSPSQFLAFVGDVFADTKGALTDRLQQAAIPAVGEAADETELAATEKAASEADAAQGKAITDAKACVAAPDDGAKRAAARVSLRAYVTAARKASRATTLTAAMIDAVTTNGTDPAPCQAALDAALAS